MLESLEDAKHSLESNDVQKTQQAIEEVAGRQRLVQDVFKGVFFSFIIFIIIALSRLHVCLYFISICYASDTECLDASASYLNVCDQEIGRRYEFKSIDTIRSSVKGRLEELCLTGR